MPKQYMGRDFMDVKILYNESMKTRDGVTLYADVYRPNNDIPYPAIVCRTPYLKDADGLHTGYFKLLRMASSGYNIVVQDCRGTGYSEGICDPAGHQDEDGYDCIEWVAQMPWCDGNVATFGASYNGFSQLALARANPPHLRAINPFMTSWTKFPAIFDFGVFSPVLFGWITSRAEDREKYYPGQYGPEAIRKMQYYEDHLMEQVSYLPMKDMPAVHIDGVPELEFQTELLNGIDDPAYLSSLGRVEGFEQTTVPTLNLTGWHDFLRDKTIYNYTQFRLRGGSQLCREGSRLIVGPWVHSDNLDRFIEGVDFGREASGDAFRIPEKVMGWYDHWLKGMPSELVDGKPVSLFIMGENKWRMADDWPLPETKYTPYYLHSDGHANTLMGDGILTETLPGAEPADRYDYDPMNACPSATDEPMRLQMQDMRPLQKRQDVLVYTAPAFTEKVTLIGPITAELYVSTSARDTDFVARVGVVRRDGSVYRLGAMLKRCRYRNGETPEPMVPDEIYKLTILAGNTGIVLQPGEAIRLDITSSLFPDADRNMNTFGRIGYESEGIVAHQTILHDTDHPSALILPVIPEA